MPTILKYSITLALFILARAGMAQDYRWTAKLDTVPKDGFYKIMLKPEISAKVQNADFSDIRLFDSKQNAVPYLLKQEPGSTNKQWFQEYTILSKEIIPNRQTTLIIHNPEKNSINNFSLVVKNNDAYKLASLSGSDDNKHWYYITKDYQLSQMYNESEVSNEKQIYFPLSNYEYYKFDISDSSEAPLNILKVGYYNSASKKNNTSTQVPLSFHQADSLKTGRTYLSLICSSAFHINKLNFEVEGPRFYRREATLYKVDTLYGKKQLTAIHDFYLSSNGSNAVFFPDFYGQEFVVEIYNKDNSPLTVKQVTAFQPTRYLVTYLTKGEHYSMQIGNTKAALPAYDISYFTDSIPAQLPELRINGTFVETPKQPETAPAEDWFKSKGWIWGTLLLVIGLLGFISYKMIKDMETKSGNTGD